MTKSTCSVDGCEGTVKVKGLCEKHYYRLRRWGDVNTVRKVVKYDAGDTCSVDSCDFPPFSLGLCSRHYAKQRKYGDAEHPPQPMGPAPKPPRLCGVDGCERVVVAKHLCQNHYVKDRRLSADPLIAATFRARVGRGNFRRRSILSTVEMLEVTNSDWLRLVRRYRGCCAYCSTPCGNLTIEHVIPIARGGRHSIGNLLPVCPSCNSSKRDRLLVEWRNRKPPLAA